MRSSGLVAENRQSSRAAIEEQDDRLISILQEDVRHPVGKIANRLGISTPTVRKRIQRLQETNILYMGVTIDLYAIGYEFLVFCGVTVAGREAVHVATDIAALPDALTVNLVEGNFDIEVVLAIKTKEEIGRLLLHVMSSIPGVHSIAPSLSLDVWKFQADRTPSSADLQACKKPQLDELNVKILDCLHSDARISMREISKRLGVTDSTVRARYRQMIERKQFKMTAVRRLDYERAQQVAYIGILVTGASAADVCAKLSAMQEISFVATMLGPYEIIACAVISEHQHMTELVEKTIPSIAGVRHLDVSHCTKNIKQQFKLGLVL